MVILRDQETHQSYFTHLRPHCCYNAPAPSHPNRVPPSTYIKICTPSDSLLLRRIINMVAPSRHLRFIKTLQQMTWLLLLPSTNAKVSPTSITSRFINIVAALPSHTVETLKRMHGDNSSVAEQHIQEVSELVSPFLIASSSHASSSSSRSPPPEIPDFFNQQVSINNLCSPKQFCDMTTKPHRMKRSPFRALARLGRVLRKHKSKKINSKRLSRKTKTKSPSTRPSKRVMLMNRLRIVYSGTGVLLMVGSLGLVTLGVADYAGWLPQMEDSGHLDYLTSQFKEFNIDNAKLTQQLYYTSLENAEIQNNSFNLIEDLKNGLLRDEEFTATIAYQLAKERTKINSFLKEITMDPPRPSTISEFSRVLRTHLSNSYTLEPILFHNCVHIRLVGFVPQKLRLYLEADLKNCSSELPNLSERTTNTWVNFSIAKGPPSIESSWKGKIDYKIAQARNLSQSHLNRLVSYNESFKNLVEKADHLPNYAMKIGLPSTLFCFTVALTLLLVFYLRRRNHRSSDSLPFSNLRLFSLAKNISAKPNLVNSDSTSPRTLHPLEVNLREAKERLLQKIQDSSSTHPDLLEDSTTQLRKMYADYHDANVNWRDFLQLEHNTGAASELDFERLHVVSPAFQQAVAAITSVADNRTSSY